MPVQKPVPILVWLTHPRSKTSAFLGPIRVPFEGTATYLVLVSHPRTRLQKPCVTRNPSRKKPFVARRENNNEALAYAIVGTLTAIGAATVLCIPFVGFGPVISYSAGVLVLGAGLRMLDEMLKQNQRRPPD